MLQSVLNLVGLGPSVDFKKLKNEGAIILDVRSKGEYAQGHIKGSINIAVDHLANNLSKISKNKVIITCCASGGRSGMAKRILESNGYTEVHNGGGWASLQSKI
ncbi:MAG: rhodanese-like domain-containing protein [Cytophagales bacterium]|jgi:rhodanese-related sulfurtransferase|nr:rhodanese-like domain-containing protein [Cytophagales bacterium]MCA6365715.1 rhodanese-like domain-containing protein [Cytophagales bacterium]MCA6370361.1 rhodanese-like domain-containing protein [Cytophagales bacterium]MCA6375651.1 rhodanese-like domain-containing protein [Cytophagales bacterium]MCA6385225.1 rhodanese-like domain-containing protein [Cytophagales bacterium]